MAETAFILDTNLLLLLIVGTTCPSYIKKHKRLRAYSQDDFILLEKLISRASKIIITPNTLTETSNLARHISDPAKTHISKVFRAAIIDTDEIYLPSKIVVEEDEFFRLGLTDCILLHHASGGSHTLLTADLDLYLAAACRGYTAVNFNHCREGITL
jgi:hypothetical protein